MASFGITARNHEQKAAIQALYNDKPFLFLTGKAGTGKTLVSQAVGLERTLENKDFRKLIYTRLQVQLGEHLGYLSGDVDEKTYPFIAPFMDNLEAMSNKAKDIVDYFALSGGKNDKRQKIYFDPIQTLRGRSLLEAFAMIDEAQNLDIHTIAAIGTRPALGTKIIFLGNFAQIDTPKLRTPEMNGMYKLLEGLYREDPTQQYFDHINLTIEERHPAVSLVEKILRNSDVDPRFEKLEQKGEYSMIKVGEWVRYETTFTKETKVGFILEVGEDFSKVAVPDLRRTQTIRNYQLSSVERPVYDEQMVDCLIDIALDSKDKDWFDELVKMKGSIKMQMKVMSDHFKYALMFTEFLHKKPHVQGYADEESRDNAYEQFCNTGEMVIRDDNLGGVQRTVKPVYVARMNFVDGTVNYTKAIENIEKLREEENE